MWRQRLREPLFAGLITVLGGLAIALFPLEILSWVLRIVGALLLVLQIFRIVETVRLAVRDGAFVLSLISDGAVALLGFILLVSPLNALQTLATLIGVYLAVTSGIAIYRAARLGGRGAAFIVSTVLSILTAVVGVWLVIYPASLYGFIGIFIGIALIIKGLLLIVEGIVTGDGPKKNNGGDYYSDDFVDKSHEL